MPRPTPLDHLRRHALAAAFPRPTTLPAALAAIGFVQADPIRAPARAQDLILRHRVRAYRAGELERRYPRLALEEGYLHVYGFMTPDLHALLHPRRDPALPDGMLVPDSIAQSVLAHVRHHGPSHPADIAIALGTGRTVNAWGGQSQATTRALDLLQHHGLLRVAGRRRGIRVYAAAPSPAATLAPADRLARLALHLARQLAPVAQPTLTGLVARVARMTIGEQPRPGAVADLLRRGELQAAEIDGVTYLWPAGTPPAPRPAPALRFLAPFDPLVWCRRRFEHLWGWEYRFEAYTKPEKRLRGYYALPLLWRGDVIGWVNLARTAHGLDATPGFIAGRPDDPAFTRAFDAEVAAMAAFLHGDTTA
ncbi:MAG: YcaQ family DNA glycosylase [Acetobacteraceae bacterium]|nr:YcaQ family DNA glycosylase [Acetobacteraceae bacterium]